MTYRRALVLTAGLVFVPAVALANAGTPLMWATLFHLLAGNAVIGLLESAIVVRISGTPIRRTVVLAILANYVSCLAGLIAWVAPGSTLDLGVSLWEGLWLFVIGMAAAYAVTVVLEWPFVTLAHPPGPDRWRRGLRANLIAQTGSYLVLVPTCLVVSPMQLYTSSAIRRDPGTFAKPPLADVYYLDGRSGDVVRVRTDGTHRARVADGTSEPRLNDRLMAAVASTAGGWVLRLVHESSAGRIVVQETGGDVIGEEPDERGRYRTLWAMRYEAADFRAETPWTASCGFWPGEGLMVRQGDRRTRRVALDAYGANWPCRAPTVLPSGQIVFQLGPHIALYDPETYEIASLGQGQGPVVVVPRGGR